jgi:Suppressor of fused protein (SUFU)
MEYDSENQAWESRQKVLEYFLGAAEDIVFHSPTPLNFGGNADVLMFKNGISGVVYSTVEFFYGFEEQQNTEGWDEFELIICHRDTEEQWGVGVVSVLGRYTLGSALGRYHTMDYPANNIENSTISALFFDIYASFSTQDDAEENAGILLAIGITQDELDYVNELRNHDIRPGPLLKGHLMNSDIYPYTDLIRESVVNANSIHQLPAEVKWDPHQMSVYGKAVVQILVHYVNQYCSVSDLFEFFKHIPDFVKTFTDFEYEPIWKIYENIHFWLEEQTNDEPLSEDKLREEIKHQLSIRFA